jgi:hypothetical protein
VHGVPGATEADRAGIGNLGKAEKEMISSAPTTIAGNLFDLEQKVRAFVGAAMSAAARGLTVSDFAELTVSLLRIVISTADTLPADNADKKAWCIQAVADLFDAVANFAVPRPMIPIWWAIRPAVRNLVLLAAGGTVESLLPLVRMAKQ